MKENDPLDPLLREWQAPESSPGLDARVGAAYRAMHRPSPWRRLWTMRVAIPVPVFAALLLLAAVLWIQFRRGPTPPAPPSTGTASPEDGGYLSRLETTGFQPLPNGAARVVRSGERKK